jgi:hypothetical protein
MKLLRLCLLCLVCAAPLYAQAADAGRYTIVDGDARVLRGVTWFVLVPGAALQEGDVVDVGDGAMVQAELSRGAIVSIGGPAAAYAAALPAKGPADWIFTRGWAKVRGLRASPLRLRSQILELDIADGIVVAHLDPAQSAAFVEQGSALASVPAARGKSAPAGDVRDGEFVLRVAERPATFGDRAPPAFVTAMPRYMRDALPAMIAQFQGRAPVLRAGRDASFAEAEPWLSGVTRATFVRRFAPRLKDAEFRVAAAEHADGLPEWRHVLRPEPPPSTDDNAPAATERRKEVP